MATLGDGAVWEALGSTAFEVARGILWDALGALGDACMTVRSLVDAQETRAVPAGMEEYMPVALRSAIERRDALYEFFVELYAAEPQQGAAAAYKVDPKIWMLTGGDDHALVACLPNGVELPDGFLEIGCVSEGAAQVTVDGSEPEWLVGNGGFTHFA